MQIEIKVLSDVRRITQLLARSRVDKIDVASHRRQSVVRVALTRAKIEENASPEAKVPVIPCELVFNGVGEVRTQPKRFDEKTDFGVVECEAAERGYRCYLTTPEKDEMVLNMPALAGTFRDL